MKLVRITTVPVSLEFLLPGQMRFMQANGFDVTMISADGPSVSRVVDFEGCPHIVVPLTRKITPFKDLKALWLMFKILRSIRPDIVHTHTPKAGLIGMVASWLARVPNRMHTVAGLPLEASSGLKYKILVVVEKITYACATVVLPNSPSLKEFILSKRLAHRDKLDIIGKCSSNGIDINEFSDKNIDESKLKEIKHSISHDPARKYLLFVGRVVRDKGIEELVEAFVILRRNNPKLSLILVGPLENDLDPLRPDILSEIESNEDIIVTGFSNYVKYFMYLADLFVFPSHREGLPNVLLQAGCMKCPVVCSNIGGNIDVVEHDFSGIIFEKGNRKDLLNKLSFGINNSDYMIKMSDNLFAWIIAHLDRKNIHKLLLDKYNENINS